MPMIQKSSVDVVVFGDGISTIARLRLNNYPIAVLLVGITPDRVTVVDINSEGTPVIPSSLHGSIVTVTFASAIPSEAGKTLRIIMEFDI